MSDYMTCVDQNGRCGNPFHDHAKVLEDGECTRRKAWLKKAKPCPGCGTLVPEHLGERLSPDLLKEFKAGNVRVPKLTALEAPVFVKIMKPDEAVCPDDATRVRKMVPGGRISLKVGDALRPFIPAAEYNTIMAEDARIAREAETRRADQERAQAEEATRQAQALAEAESRRIRYLANLAKRIKTGDSRGILFSRRKEEGGVKLTECAVHVNAPKLCGCGGWHHWDSMPAVIDLGAKKAFGFGPACAALIAAELPEDPFLSMLPAAIAACKTEDPARYLREREEGPRVTVTLAPGARRFDPHADGYGTARKRTVKPPPVLSAEEQARRAAESEAARKKRHEERQKRERELATDPAAGAMAPRPPKNGKKAKAADKKPKKRGAQRQSGQEAHAK